MTDDVAAVLSELVDREPLFHRTELGTSREVFEAMTAPDFWEVGASGEGPRVTRRATVWERVESGWRIVYHQGTPA